MILSLVVLSFFFTKVQACQLISDTQLKHPSNVLSLQHLRTSYSALHSWIPSFSLTTCQQIKHWECILPCPTSWVTVTVWLISDWTVVSQSMDKQRCQERFQKERVSATWPLCRYIFSEVGHCITVSTENIVLIESRTIQWQRCQRNGWKWVGGQLQSRGWIWVGGQKGCGRPTQWLALPFVFI